MVRGTERDTARDTASAHGDTACDKANARCDTACDTVGRGPRYCAQCATTRRTARGLGAAYSQLRP